MDLQVNLTDAATSVALMRLSSDPCLTNGQYYLDNLLCISMLGPKTTPSVLVCASLTFLATFPALLCCERPSKDSNMFHPRYAGCRSLIQCLRRMGPAHCYATSMSPPALEQTIAAMHVLRGRDNSDRGVKKIQQLHDNANYFREKLAAMGCSVLGSKDSPVMVRIMDLLLCQKP